MNIPGKIALAASAGLLLAGAATAQQNGAPMRQRALDGSMRTSLGVTVSQLRDADLIGADGEELGEVDAVLLGADGQPGSVLVELEDDIFGDGRVVELELSDLTAQEANAIARLWDDEIDLVTDQTPQALEALPNELQERT
jgi:hypothetical protein